MTLAFAAAAQSTFPLYEGKIPNGKQVPDEEESKTDGGITRVSKISVPTLTIFLPSKETANGTAIIICPGGGYRINAIDHEGLNVAKKFAEMGVTAFVLKYRIPDDRTMEIRNTGPLQDAQQAIRVVRQRASEWNVNPDRVGIMGFSAGGHLASTAGTHFTSPVLAENASINLRPNFMILIYPVISFDETIGHMGSREQLIGKNPPAGQVQLFSNDLQVTKDTPPTFLVHASDDAAVKPENSIRFYQKLLENNVPAELHIYQNGGHGFGMINKTTDDLWMDRCQHWLKSNGWL